MKKSILITLALLLMTMSDAGAQLLSEQFILDGFRLGSAGQAGQIALFSFDLAALSDGVGNVATLFKNNGTQASIAPIFDENLYDPASSHLTEAKLQFILSDSDIASENGWIYGIFDGGAAPVLASYSDVNGYKGITIDLSPYLDSFQDGSFFSLIFKGAGNVTLTSALLTATAEANEVPLPAAAWLLASGLIGLVGLRRKMLS